MSFFSEWVFVDRLPSCPELPPLTEPIRATVLREFGNDRGAGFYLSALECGQSMWRRGLPAQALLMMNRAFGADLIGDESVLLDWPLPYAATAWVLQHREESAFVGNPRRHYQHLATRMVEPRKTLRSWRAWACWALACEIDSSWSADEVQLANEPIIEPDHEEISQRLIEHGLPGEAVLWKNVLFSVTNASG